MRTDGFQDNGIRIGPRAARWMAMQRIRLIAALAALVPAIARGEEPRRSAAPGILRQLDTAFSELAERVSPAVVQILVSGYGPAASDDAHTATALIARQHAVGSGVIVDPEGYVVTNAHVVQGAEKIVVVPPAARRAWPREPAGRRRRDYTARLVGIHPESDIAVLKIEAKGLPSLPLRSAQTVRQGELVFAVGTPQGLASTVTMGIVSSASRQLDVDAPMLFIQTDAPINPGNSGGPLVNAEGEVVGINTFIFSGSGGSEGLGFAIPARVVRFVYEALRKRGYVQRIEIGITAQGITPQLAAGLGLSRDSGVVVSDVVPGGPAERAGLRDGDVLEAIDGRTIAILPDLTASLYLAKDARVRLNVLRGAAPIELEVRTVERERPIDEMVQVASPEKHLVRQLGIVAVDVNDDIQQKLHLRRARGVVVLARVADGPAPYNGLVTGDTIYALDQTPIDSMETLRAALQETKGGEATVLQIEREARLKYLVFEAD
jgi:serine protease Do